MGSIEKPQRTQGYIFSSQLKPTTKSAPESMHTEAKTSNAEKILAWYTLAASATGAVPVPAASAAIIAENSAMIAHISSVMGTPVSVKTVVESLGCVGAVNMIGRSLFIEGAKLLSWGTGSAWALAGLSAIGASTAGVQTYILGRLAIEIAKQEGASLRDETARSLIEECKNTYQTFVQYWSKQNISKPA
jgi:uncharacterized protein (DUF697 family)